MSVAVTFDESTELDSRPMSNSGVRMRRNLDVEVVDTPASERDY